MGYAAIASTDPVVRPTIRDAYKLMQEGNVVMEEMERNGIRIDLDYIEDMKNKIAQRIKTLKKKMVGDEIYKQWQRHYGSRMKMSSRAQLTTVLFDDLGYEYPGVEKDNGSYEGGADILEDLGLPFVDTYLEMERIKKARSTYLRNIAFETVDGICHPNFGLHLAVSYRGQSDHPNFTNMPMRNPQIKKIVRRAIRARKGHHLVDLDFKGSEVNAAAWYHKDPVMLEYIETNPGRMHFDLGMQLYKVPESLMTEEIRFASKNGFVFAEFYGDWYLSCANRLWRYIDKLHLKTKNGIPLKKWLKKHGVTCRGDLIVGEDPVEGSFEEHVRAVEKDFWNKRFKIYKQWKDEWWEAYQERGYLDMLSGFRVSGPLNRKNAINYPIQGTAFHCLLWCLIRIRQLLRKYKMKTLLVGQIHDDAVSDVPHKELKDYVEIAQQVITVDLKKHWPWIITPMRVDAEVTPIGGTWYEKEKYAA